MQQSWDLIDRHDPATTAINQKDQDRIADLRRRCDELAVNTTLDSEDT